MWSLGRKPHMLDFYIRRILRALPTCGRGRSRSSALPYSNLAQTECGLLFRVGGGQESGFESFAARERDLGWEQSLGLRRHVDAASRGRHVFPAAVFILFLHAAISFSGRCSRYVSIVIGLNLLHRFNPAIQIGLIFASLALIVIPAYHLLEKPMIDLGARIATRVEERAEREAAPV
jgi:hypothetical protein